MATKGDRTIPNLENATPSFLLDEIARMRVEASRLKFLDGVYKQALEARLTEDELTKGKMIEGSRYTGTYSTQTQERVDTEAVKEYFKDKPEELAKVMRIISFKTLTTKEKAVPDV